MFRFPLYLIPQYNLIPHTSYLINRITRDPLIRRNRRISSYDEYEFREMYGIDKRHEKDVMKCWGIFPTRKITLSNRSIFHREEAFLVFLARHHDYRKLSSFERHYGIEYTQLSRLFNHVSNALAVRPNVRQSCIFPAPISNVQRKDQFEVSSA